MTADEVGSTDVMAILVYDQAVDFNRLDSALKASPARGLNAKLNAVLGDELSDPAAMTYAEGNTFGVRGPAEKAAMAIVLEIEKR